MIAANKAASATDLLAAPSAGVLVDGGAMGTQPQVTEELSRTGTTVAERGRVDRGEESGVQTSIE